MSGMLLNLDLGASQSSGRAEHTSQKHIRFMKKRRFLEKKGLLKQKQLQHKQHFTVQNRNSEHQANSWDPGKRRWNQGPGIWNSFNGSKKPGNDTCLINDFHQQGASTNPDRTAPSGKPYQSGTITVNVGSDRHHSRVTCYTPKRVSSEGHGSSEQSMANAPRMKNHSKPISVQHNASVLSEFESGLPAIPSAAKPPYKMVAIDCEMVGTGPGGCKSDLARCSIVNHQGDVVYDKYILPSSPVTDYRSRWSGIRRSHLVNATPFKLAQKEILKILSGKIVVGHAIHNDFKALNYFHPKEMTRDTALIPLLKHRAGFLETGAVSLKRLTKQLLHKDIQTGRSGHSSVEDAKATMELYRVIEAEWERQLVSVPALQ
ncbi:interferon-stimulated 20 kDa exonuclease-like 2 [Ascaphus truei]|uniref:interferon-stimulated 20 kDa exonuclease-like 2 n=1 Tax=Ascaphus truei TaxID=8439 RepID=UPI003F59A3C5